MSKHKRTRDSEVFQANRVRIEISVKFMFEYASTVPRSAFSTCYILKSTMRSAARLRRAEHGGCDRLVVALQPQLSEN